jgi:hypothetical protein
MEQPTLRLRQADSVICSDFDKTLLEMEYVSNQLRNSIERLRSRLNPSLKQRKITDYR